jgi:hypothetical protein
MPEGAESYAKVKAAFRAPRSEGFKRALSARCCELHERQLLK